MDHVGGLPDRVLVPHGFWDLVAFAAAARAGSAHWIADILRDRVIPNLTLCVTVENDRFVRRVDSLRAAPAARRVVVAEPLLGPLPSLVCLLYTSDAADD